MCEKVSGRKAERKDGEKHDKNHKAERAKSPDMVQRKVQAMANKNTAREVERRTQRKTEKKSKP